jgi:hypothetical protein
MNKTIFPDGTLKNTPIDQEKFYDYKNNETYTWDEGLSSWVDSRGKLFIPDFTQLPISDAFGFPFDMEDSPVNFTTNTTKPSKGNGCECGSWVYGENTGHSDYCPLYKK